MNSRSTTGNKFAMSPNSFENNDNKENHLKEVVTPLGDVYILNEKTNEKFIKGTQRSDGTFRKTIRVRTDYMPQEENCVYQVKGKILEEQNRSGIVSSSTKTYASENPLDSNTASAKEVVTNSILKILANKSAEKKVPGWNPINENENENQNGKNLKKKKKKKKKKKETVKKSRVNRDELLEGLLNYHCEGIFGDVNPDPLPPFPKKKRKRKLMRPSGSFYHFLLKMNN
ncbi:hypothetical protein C922_03181 [Plasmodium inui San Antonio 1]|uniref:WIBG Mago-binding domain-containing protein n=1 Tax=Plasmodium inui San Antonio 1 TaxID=1237626 RepID=W7A076_9APIC|nr:hypothetical protein C922_03181 [Plasmodium inui San Antonio 1]EUD66547.1 hypothetical protein C922_03181 [Plasmodium inui San Antonio 1]